MEFYFSKFYHKDANNYWVIDQIAPPVSQIHRVSVFCGPILHTSFVYIYTKPKPLTPWNVASFDKEHFLVLLYFFLSHTSLTIMLIISPFHTVVLLCWCILYHYIIYHWFHITCGWHLVGRWSVKCVEWRWECNHP